MTLCAVLASFAAAPAFAWVPSGTGASLLLVRQSTDATIPADVRVYYDYEGGTEPTPSVNFAYTTSYKKSRVFADLLVPSIDAVSVPLDSSHSVQLVEYPGGRVAVWRPVVDVQTIGTVAIGSLPSVSITGTVPVRGSVSISDLPTVSVNSTPSAVQTVTGSVVASLSGADRDVLDAMSVGLGLVVLGTMIYAGMKFGGA